METGCPLVAPICLPRRLSPWTLNPPDSCFRSGSAPSPCWSRCRHKRRRRDGGFRPRASPGFWCPHLPSSPYTAGGGDHCGSWTIPTRPARMLSSSKPLRPASARWPVVPCAQLSRMPKLVEPERPHHPRHKEFLILPLPWTPLGRHITHPCLPVTVATVRSSINITKGA